MAVVIEELLDDRQVAKLMGASRRTLQIWRHMGKGPKYVKLGGLVRYKPSVIAEFMEKSTIVPGGA